MAKTPAQAAAEMQRKLRDAQSIEDHKVVVPTTPKIVVPTTIKPRGRPKPILGTSRLGRRMESPKTGTQVSTSEQNYQWASEKISDLVASTRDNAWTQLKLGVLGTGAVAVAGGRAASRADYHGRGTSLQILGVFLPMMGWVGLSKGEAKTNYMYEYAGNLTETPEAKRLTEAFANAASTTADNAADLANAVVAVQEQVKRHIINLDTDGDGVLSAGEIAPWSADIIEEIREEYRRLTQRLPSLPSAKDIADAMPSAKDIADGIGLTEAAKVPGRVGKDITKVADAVATAIGGGTSAAGGAAGSISTAASSIANDVSTATRVVIIIAGVYIVYRIVR